jgi:signal transduction histidine kinase
VDAERGFAHDRRVELRWNAEPAPIPCSMDSAKITCVCRELVRNAIEAASPDGCVTVDVAATTSSARFVVRDDGVGIAPELQARIYEPFFSTRDHGRGLGLAIVHTFVSLHRGAIVLTSNDRGTSFEVTIPRNST